MPNLHRIQQTTNFELPKTGHVMTRLPNLRRMKLKSIKHSRNGQNFIRKVSANCMQWLSDMKEGGGAKV